MALVAESRPDEPATPFSAGSGWQQPQTRRHRTSSPRHGRNEGHGKGGREPPRRRTYWVEAAGHWSRALLLAKRLSWRTWWMVARLCMLVSGCPRKATIPQQCGHRQRDGWTKKLLSPPGGRLRLGRRMRGGTKSLISPTSPRRSRRKWMRLLQWQNRRCGALCRLNRQ